MKNSTLQAADHGGHCARAGSEAKPCRLLEVEVAQLVGQEEHWAWELWKHRWAWLCKNIAQKHNNILEKYCTGAQPCSEIYSRSDCSLSLIALRFIMTDCCFARSWILSSLTIKQLCGAGKVPCLCYNWVSRVLTSLFIYQKFAIYDYIWSNWATHVLASLFLEEAALL